MPDYRIYYMDAADHIRSPPAVVACEDDESAVDKAKQLLDGRIIEVWELNRKIARLTPSGRPKSKPAIR